MSTDVPGYNCFPNLPADYSLKPQLLNHLLTLELCVSGSLWKCEPIYVCTHKQGAFCLHVKIIIFSMSQWVLLTQFCLKWLCLQKLHRKACLISTKDLVYSCCPRSKQVSPNCPSTACGSQARCRNVSYTSCPFEVEHGSHLAPGTVHTPFWKEKC